MSVPGTLLALLFAAFAGVAQAVEFDEKIKAPRATSSADLKVKLASVASRLEGSEAAGRIEAIRDTKLARDRFDARWMLGAMVDARVPLPELSELGLEPRPDGSYAFNSRQHPQWQPLEQKLLLLSQPDVVTGLQSTLTSRGFRPEDHEKLRTYVESHDLKRATGERQLALAVSASKMAKKLQRLKRLDDNFMASFFYQKQWEIAQGERQWVLGLLDALEPRAQRILESYFSEVSSNGFIAPTPTAEAFKYERELLLRPDFEQLARTAFEEGRL